MIIEENKNPIIHIVLSDRNHDKTNEKKYTNKKAKYTIININKNKKDKPTCLTSENIYRSVIFDENETTMLSVSPSKIIDNELFNKRHVAPYSSEHNSYINELIEGTMIQLFYDTRIKSWQIATKSAIGGNYWYFKTKYDDHDNSSQEQITFYNMFLDALHEKRNSDLNETSFVQKLFMDHSYTFILQHPENHIVFTINEPKIYLVSIYKIENIRDQLTGSKNQVKLTCILPVNYEKWDCFPKHIVYFPKQYTSQELVQLSFSSKIYEYVGIMILDKVSGERTTIKNPGYEELKMIRGNNPNLHYQFLSLKRIDKIDTFLYFFKKYTKLFSQFEKRYSRFISDLHNCYMELYVNKTIDLNKISKKYYIHIWRLHYQIYIPSINSKKKIITKEVVKTYFGELEPKEQFFYLNFTGENFTDIYVQ